MNRLRWLPDLKKWENIKEQKLMRKINEAKNLKAKGKVTKKSPSPRCDNNIKTTYLILCSFPMSRQKSLSRHGPQAIGGFLWCLAGRCLLWIFSVLYVVGWDLYWSSQFHWCSNRLESWEFGSQCLNACCGPWSQLPWDGVLGPQWCLDG